jgi:hypothetical protein
MPVLKLFAQMVVSAADHIVRFEYELRGSKR